MQFEVQPKVLSNPVSWQPHVERGKTRCSFGFRPHTIEDRGMESFARELSMQLGRHGWESVLCFEDDAAENIRRFLEASNVTLCTCRTLASLSGSQSVYGRPSSATPPQNTAFTLHRLSRAYPWLTRLYSVNKVFFTDHGSRPEDHVIHRANWSRRVLTRLITSP